MGIFNKSLSKIGILLILYIAYTLFTDFFPIPFFQKKTTQPANCQKDFPISSLPDSIEREWPKGTPDKLAFPSLKPIDSCLISLCSSGGAVRVNGIRIRGFVSATCKCDNKIISVGFKNAYDANYDTCFGNVTYTCKFSPLAPLHFLLPQIPCPNNIDE